MEGLDLKAIPQAIVFAIFAFVGFESAATLGKETRDPTTTIPKAINWTAISAGLFFIFTTYVITHGLRRRRDQARRQQRAAGRHPDRQEPLI